MKEFDLITFDCYGTLIDWETVITEAFRDEASRDGIELLRDAIPFPIVRSLPKWCSVALRS
ncbi:MAG: hypothetical protein QF619_03525 [Candidatus Binatia bacterium]|jgi:2-haloacid dehalogenase/putative hydrolase of the HAD superfamily|nr:hypothetical protein [Candidatus Binatia bacterium]|tara:strand:- start:185 stop:367 length:183 start_codon:yes stop_codon:yes gene_type:complete